MSKESYARGFCKAAEAAGVDPVALAKFASTVKGPNGELYQVPHGDIGWLGSTNPVHIVNKEVGRTDRPYVAGVAIPQGAASITNGPNATVHVQRVTPGRKGFLGIGSSPAVTNSVPESVWKPVDMMNDDKKYYTPANNRIWKLMMMLQEDAQKGNTK